MMRIARVLFALVLAAGLLAACGDDDDDAAGTTTTAAAGTTEPSGTLTDADIAKCIDADEELPPAGTEFVFSWGGGLTKERVEQHIAPAFEEVSGYPMTVIGESGSATMAKIIGASGAAGIDVLFTSHATLEQGRAADVLESLDYSRLPETEAYTDDLLDPAPGGDLTITVTQFAYGVAYNTAELAERELPEPDSTEDVLDPVYGDAMAIFTPPFQSAYAQIAIVNDILDGPDDDPAPGIEALAGLEDAQHIPGTTELNNAVANGDVALWFTASATAQELADEGFPIAFVGNPAYFSGIYVVTPTGSSQKGIACLFTNWVASEDGQRVLQLVNGNLPTRPEVPVRDDSLLLGVADEERHSYPDLIATLPSIEDMTVLWNQAVQ